MTTHALSASATAPVADSRLRAVANPGGYDYLLSLPSNHSAAPGNRWPLLLFLHGAAQRGSDVWKVAEQGLPKLLLGPAGSADVDEAPAIELSEAFIVVAPQCPHYEVWEDAKLLAFIDDVIRNLSVDAKRIYLTGLSMGGFGAWSLGIRHAGRFAALVPICGGGRVTDVIAAAKHRATALESLGVWAFHGATDTVVPPEESQRMITALEKAGVRDVRLTLYPEAAHDSWSAAYANPELYAWLLRHVR